MTVNVEITKTGGENSTNVIRKFTRRMQGTGLVRHMRKKRYRARAVSKAVKKKQALRRIERNTELEKLIKEGKAPEPRGRRR